MEKITKDYMKLIVDEVIKENAVTIEWYDRMVRVQKLIDFSTAGAIVKNVADACFDGDGDYNPSIKDYIMRMSIVTMYSDIELPESPEERYAILYGTDLYHIVVDVIDKDQLSEIIDNINDSIRYKIEANKSAIMSDVTKIYSRVEQMIYEFEQVFKGTSADDISALVRSMSDTKLDEKKLVSEILKQKQEADE